MNYWEYLIRRIDIVARYREAGTGKWLPISGLGLDGWEMFSVSEWVDGEAIAVFKRQV